MTVLQRIMGVALIWLLIMVTGLDQSSGAVNKKYPFKEAPGVETKIKQVPSLGVDSTPQWKVYWEKARLSVLQKKYVEAIQDFRRALSLKPNLDEARQELSQVLLTLERLGEAINELEILAEHQPLNQKIQRELADLLSQKKEYRRANEMYQKLLQKDPDNLGVRLSLASNFYQINEWEKALIEWRQVLIRDSQNIEARTHLAEVLGATKRLDESILILEGLVKQFPKQMSFKKKLAQTLVLSHRNKEALPYLQELNRQDPGDLEIQLSLAQVLSAGKNYNQSLSFLDTYLKNKPDNQSALLEKARALLNTGNTAEALEVYAKLLKIEPGNIELHREVAEAYFSSGKLPEALNEFEHLVKHFPDEIGLYEKIGKIYFENKNYRQAIPPLQKVLSLAPEDISAQMSLARAYAFSGEKEKAVPLFRKILLKRPDQNLQTELADLLIESQNYSEGFQIYGQLLAKDPDLWEVRYKLATGLYRQKEFKQAAKQLGILVRQRPDQTAVWSLAGYNALEQGDYVQAQKAFQKVLVLGDDRSIILIRLGEVWRLLGRPWKAIKYLDWALIIKPADIEISVEKAMALIDGGGLALARKILDPLVHTHPKSFKVQRAWVRLLAALDRIEEAEAGWTQLEKRFPMEQDVILQDQAEFYGRRGKPDAALTALKMAEMKNTKNLDIKRKIGRSLFNLGRWKELESYYQDLEKEHILLAEVHQTQATFLIKQEKYGPAKEQLWQALLDAPHSVRIRFWLWWLYARDKNWFKAAQNINETLLEFSRNQEGGLLELADCYREIKEPQKAQAIYKELMEKGEDDDVLLSLDRIYAYLQTEKKGEELQETLENMQKRFPRNQRIPRLLIEYYSLEKEYALAVKTIDGLLKVEDPRDPVLIVKKARLMERWLSHWDSQALYQKLLDPSVDQLFRKKVSEIISPEDPLVVSLFKGKSENHGLGVVNPIFERAEHWLKTNSLEAKLHEKFTKIIESLKAEDLIQKKVFLEKEGKDYLWRSQASRARTLLDELKKIDPDNEEVYLDLEKSSRIQN